MAVTVRFDGKAQNLVAATKQAKTANDQLLQSYKASTAEGLAQERINQRAIALSRQLTRGTESLASKVRTLRTGLRAGALTQEEYNRSLEALRQQQQKNILSFDGLAAQIGKVNIPSLVAKYATWATAIGVVTGAVHRLRDALRLQAEAERQAAENLLVSQRQTGGQLAQLTSSRRELAKLNREARTSFAAGIDRNEANRLVFQLSSLGFNRGERDLLTSLGKSTLLDPSKIEETAIAVGGVRAAFGKQEAGSLAQALSKMAAAADVGATSLEQVIQGSAIAGAAARQLGLGEEEAASAIAVLSDQLGGAERATTYTAELFRKLDRAVKEGIIDPIDRGDFAGSLRKVQRQAEAAGVTVQSLIGGDRAADALVALANNTEKYNETISKVNAATEDYIIKLGRNAAETNRLAIAQAQAANAAELAAEPAGRRRVAREVLRDRYRAFGRRTGLIPDFVSDIAARQQAGFANVDLPLAKAIQLFDPEFKSLLERIAESTANTAINTTLPKTSAPINVPET